MNIYYFSAYMNTMEFSYEGSWTALEEILGKREGIAASWEALIDFHAQIKPAAYWSALRNVDFTEERAEMADWLHELAETYPLPDSVQALWIGIVQFYDEEQRRTIYAYHVLGADAYDPQDAEWATEPSWQPELGHFVPDSLKMLNSALAEAKEDFSFLDWLLPVAASAFVFDNIIQTQLDHSKFRVATTPLPVTIGYDNGDFISLSPIVAS